MRLRTKQILLWLLVSCSTSLSAQIIYISTLDGRLLEVDLETCTETFLTDINGSTTDISFHPNGQLYAIGSAGQLYELDINTGNLTFIDQLGPSTEFFTALTIDANGLMYAAGLAGELWTYDLDTGIASFLGDVGFGASGDLTFNGGQLYMASDNDDIILIDLDNPSNSGIAVNGNVPGNLFGIVSFAEDCSDINSFALTNNGTGIYLIDFENASLSLFCSFSINASGGASTFEFFGAFEPIQFFEVFTEGFDCSTGIGNIFVDAIGGNGQLSYSLDGINFQPSFVFADVPLQDYIIYVRDEEGCEEQTQLFIEPQGGPLVNGFEVNVPSCDEANGQILIEVEGGSLPLIYSIDGGNSFAMDSIFTNVAPGTYQVVVQDADGCTDESTVNVPVTGPPFIEELLVNYPDCEAGDALVTVLASGDASPLQYAIDGGDFTSDREFLITETGTYTFSIIDFTGCVRSEELFVEVNVPIEIIDIIVQNNSCGEANGAVELIATGGSNDLSYSLNGITQTNGSFENLAPGDYSILVTDNGPCNTIMVDFQVVGSSAPSLTVESVSPANCRESDGQIALQFQGGTSPFSLFINGQIQSPEPVVTQLAAGDYFLELIDSEGCSDTTRVAVLASNCPIYVPNAFSPNSDGINDFFEIYGGIDIDAQIQTLQIYDRWGGQVFEARQEPLGSRQARWDGSYRGRLAQAGVYVYFLELAFANGEVLQQTGDLTLVR